MRLLIQIPCYNEAETLALVVNSIPKNISGIDKIEILIIDDGSQDNTSEIAAGLGVQHIIRVAPRNRRWLGRAFRIGVDFALKNNFDILVNVDADNQYPACQITELINPILCGKSDLVIGDRNPHLVQYFSRLKRFLQRIGNILITFLTGHYTPDALSGFRAFNKKALLSVYPLTNFTYTIDSLVQAQLKGLEVLFIPIQVNPPTRESRLIKNNLEKCLRSALTVIRVVLIYSPIRLFSLLAAVSATLGSTLFLITWILGPTLEQSYSNKLINSLSILLILIAILAILLGGLAEIASVNRRLSDEILKRLREMEINKK